MLKQFSKITEERFIKTILKFRLTLQFLLLMLWPSPKTLSFKRGIFTWNLFIFNLHPTPSNSGSNCVELAPDPTCKSSVPQDYTTRLQTLIASLYMPRLISMCWDNFTNAEPYYFICILMTEFISVQARAMQVALPFSK